MLKNDPKSKQTLVTHRDTNMGSQALHLAATTGNRKILNILVHEFEADPYERTSLSGQTVHHCAA